MSQPPASPLPEKTPAIPASPSPTEGKPAPKLETKLETEPATKAEAKAGAVPPAPSLSSAVPLSPPPSPSHTVIHAETKPVVKMPPPKVVAVPRVTAIRMESQRGFRWGRLAEAFVFALLAGGASYYVAQQLFAGEEQVVTQPVGPVAALLTTDGAAAPAIQSTAPTVGQ
ncbi:hypothetical protein SAMN05444156_0727 [Verrucomicrobium sp. GAS474]|uniref:hypothetical protein n=1 Tax=Verrucomicrobium sp. GAS474 TaxID=1882831 RepID=UPI00087DCAFB|nr:hypothetical protein [Verrucomicrobium sp. GAS474]SDT91783.1 hypothetical protein SAMN05444156_0727 [Verrucomicrobium sp. GAS474]